MSMVKHKRGTLYTLDVQQEAELMALVNKSDEDIDYSAYLLVAKHGLTPNAAIFCQIQVLTRNKT